MKPLQAKLAQYTAPQEAKAAGVYPYFRAISSEQEPEVIIDGKKVLMFGSNCYTGLVSDPRIKEAAIEAIKKYGTGCAGSPFLNGTLDIHKQLEARIAEYIGKEDVMIYSTGFEVNLGVVSCLTAVRIIYCGTNRTTPLLSKVAACRSRSSSNISTTTWSRSKSSSRAVSPTN